MQAKIYPVTYTTDTPNLNAGWNSPFWETIPALHIDCFQPGGSSHQPETAVRLVHDGTSFLGIFRVEDRYVRCVHSGYQAQVYRDSCVEFFVSPDLTGGYLNFEFNCGGALLCYHIEDATRLPDGGLAKATPLLASELTEVQIHHTLPTIVDPEIETPTTWELQFSIPFYLFSRHFPYAYTTPEARWHANFYKCADDSSHPHWASWAPIPVKNFHLPESFGEIILAASGHDHGGHRAHPDGYKKSGT